ncbi:MAG: S8 family serine peptidase [Bacteroidia bacterium]
MKISLHFTLMIALAFFLTKADAQVLVNQEWVAQYGLPDTIAWSASVTDPGGNLYTTGNTFTVGNGADMLLTKYDSDGNLVWQETYDHDAQNDYGIALILHSDGDLTVAAALYDSNKDFDIGLLHYNSNGSLLWSSTHDYEGQYDVPTAMAEDASGNLYLTAASLGQTTDLDYLTLKFDEDGAQLWAQNYDYVGGRDVPVSLVADNGEITVTGASEDSLGEWDFYTVMYDEDGIQQEESRLDKPGIGFDEPAGIVRDNSGNFFLTGRASDNGIDYYIQTVKLDAQLNILWEVSYSHTGQDGATGLGLDSQGNVYVCGYLSDPLGQDFLLLKYEPNGALAWDRVETTGGGGPAAATSMHISGDDVIYVTGYEAINNEQRLTVIAFDVDGQKLWEQNVEDGEYVGGEIITNGASAYVSGRSFQNGNYQYVAFKYTFWDASADLVMDSTGNPTHVKDEVVVSFAPEALHQSEFESTDIIFGNIGRFVKGPILDELELEPGMSNIKEGYAYKVFKNLTIADSMSVTRLGDTIPVKYLWNTLVIRLPEHVSTVRSGSGNREADAVAGFESLYPYVWYAELNSVFKSGSVPNDDKYDNKQISLHGDNGSLNNDINVEDAWDIETGKPHVRVGVFDSGIRWSHNDLCNNNKDVFAESRVKGGWDYVSNLPIDNNKDNDDVEQSHGTKVAGINDPNPNPQNLAPEDVEEMLQLYAFALPNSTNNAPISTNSSPNELTGFGRLDAGKVMDHLIPPFDIIHYEHGNDYQGLLLFSRPMLLSSFQKVP